MRCSYVIVACCTWTRQRVLPSTLLCWLEYNGRALQSLPNTAASTSNAVGECMLCVGSARASCRAVNSTSRRRAHRSSVAVDVGARSRRGKETVKRNVDTIPPRILQSKSTQGTRSTYGSSETTSTLAADIASTTSDAGRSKGQDRNADRCAGRITLPKLRRIPPAAVMQYISFTFYSLQ